MCSEYGEIGVYLNICDIEKWNCVFLSIVFILFLKNVIFLFFFVCINEGVVYNFFLDILRYNINVFKKLDKYLFYDNYCSNSL